MPKAGHRCDFSVELAAVGCTVFCSGECTATDRVQFTSVAAAMSFELEVDAASVWNMFTQLAAASVKSVLRCPKFAVQKVITDA